MLSFKAYTYIILFFCKLRGGELGNRIELIRQSKKEENAIDIESIVSKKAK